MAIGEWQNFFNLNDQDVTKRTYLVFEADCQAEILDWFGCKNVPTAEKDRFIYSLIHFDGDCGGFYDFRAYFLAAKYVAVFPESSFADDIVEQLSEWSHSNFWRNTNKIDLNKTIAKEAGKALKTTDKSKKIAAQEKTIQSTEQNDIVISTAQKLLELEPDNKIAIASLKHLID